MSYHHTLRFPGGDLACVARAPSVLKVEDTDGDLLVVFQDGETLSLFREGHAWWGERLTDGQIRNLVQLADDIGGSVIGDEGEVYYISNGEVCEKLSARPSALMGVVQRVIQTTHPISLALFIGGVAAIVLILILRTLG